MLTLGRPMLRHCRRLFRLGTTFAGSRGAATAGRRRRRRRQGTGTIVVFVVLRRPSDRLVRRTSSTVRRGRRVTRTAYTNTTADTVHTIFALLVRRIFTRKIKIKSLSYTTVRYRFHNNITYGRVLRMVFFFFFLTH